jgi:hypothetical protein
MKPIVHDDFRDKVRAHARLRDGDVGVTAYRQDALRCVRALAVAGPMRLGELRLVSGVAAAAPILQRNVYGWFDRVQRGTYGLTVAGEQALNLFAQAIAVLDESIARETQVPSLLDEQGSN